MKTGNSYARIYQEKTVIPTYGIGEPDRNPMFLEKRVYQGSSGKVYPYPVIDKIEDEKKDKVYDAIYLENEYIKVMILPSLGGRIQRAYDKTNGYDFVYYNEVIKPALVGLLGPWISGGIEFNWPQHHRPTTYMQTDYETRENDDGSVTLRIGDLDEMYGTRVVTSFTLYPGKAYIEIRAQLYNRTSMPQTFLWWANPAVAVNDDTQSVFPPDVNAVFDHGKRAVSKFPIATGTYYKHDYSEGVDISRYRNIPVPTSYMAYKSDFNFVGGYDYGKNAGILHIADHHISPGKKQWTWGCGDFGKAWDRNLTDNNGPYIELMTGVYTDNQPDFTWLMPFEEKCFTQYFMPYKKAGYVKNASKELVVNFTAHDGKCDICVYPTYVMDEATIRLSHGTEVLFEKRTPLSVEEGFEATLICPYEEWELRLAVDDANGREIISAAPKKKEIEPIPSPAEAAKDPKEILTNEELLLTAQQIEQYRHATQDPDPWYLEGLKRDPLDSRINTAYGLLLMRRTLLEEAEKHFRNAIKRITWRTPNPYVGESLYYLGVCLLYQGKMEEAFDNFYKATWNQSECERSWYYLAAIASSRGSFEEAYYYIGRALVYNSHNIKALALKAFLLLSLGRTDEAENAAKETLRYDPFDWASSLLLTKTGKLGKDVLARNMHDRKASYIYTASDLMTWGFIVDAIDLLELSPEGPMKHFYMAYAYGKLGRSGNAESERLAGENASPLYCFPNTIEDFIVLEDAVAGNPAGAKARYYLGCLFYDRKRYQDAYSSWMESFRLDKTFPTVQRNLAIVLFNKLGKKDEALHFLESAFELDESDARVFLELDQLREKLLWSKESRRKEFEKHMDLVLNRDDLYVTYCHLLNLDGDHEKALSLIMDRKFHPWEGGEGKVSREYMLANRMLGIEAMRKGDYDNAAAFFEAALFYPENLGEGKLEGSKDNDTHYFYGLLEEKRGNKDKAIEHFRLATLGAEEPSGPMFYYDQPADMIMYQGLAYMKLGEKKAAARKFNKLSDYGEGHIFDDIKIDFFAVSLPDLQLWEDDLNEKNRAHCNFVMALADIGRGQRDMAEEHIAEALRMNGNLAAAVIHEKLMDFILENR